ncbi:MAG: cls [Candidatus Kaiserbacteria bacterium]|nr:cls [Candidatus Kaiserbacteria bacterium]
MKKYFDIKKAAKRFGVPNASPLLKSIKKYPRVELIAGAVGVLAIILFLGALLWPVQPVPHEMTLTQPLDVSSPQFLDALSGLVDAPIHTGGDVRILNNGDEFIPALIASIQNAKSTIDLSVYIWNNGKYSDQLTQSLIDAAQRGVAVRILVDAQGSNISAEEIEKLQKVGARVETFRSLSFGTFQRYHRRTHRRAIVIDGNDAYTGGMAVADYWLGDGRTQGSWRDMMFEVHGAMAQDIQHAFSDIWYETTGEALAGPTFYPAVVPEHANSYVELQTAPTGFRMPIREIFLLTIHSAKNKLFITNPYFLPDRETIAALAAASRSGVDVRILVPDPNTSPVQWAGQVNYAALLEAGVKIYEYDRMIHTKLMVADGAWSIIGSANFDNRSRALNDEVVLGIQDTKFASSIEQVFTDDISHAHLITPDEWKNRSIFRTFASYVCWLFSKQL